MLCSVLEIIKPEDLMDIRLVVSKLHGISLDTMWRLLFTTSSIEVSDYRPIACCTVLYKCISKVIINRINGYLDSLIDRAQSALITGRRITDNIHMAHKLVSGYHSRAGPPRYTLKIDIKKSYDTVDWRFLHIMLHGMGFHPVMVKWIREMVSTTLYWLVINGNTYGFFHGEGD
ncbi:uncharacterized protein LOC112503237 [Cynara cardunculus var. scolymus]|uniref:uncharacterized protein LOC112503237 n=1 Tax=Cynara cardunculus var. scolymus TaxID=59895 RepID=UPI000D62EF6E|nr:uncharacterized protein LOC112503237 [Cynara cardunculus var. scolymus]